MIRIIEEKRTKILTVLGIALCFFTIILISYLSHNLQSKKVLSENVNTIVYNSASVKADNNDQIYLSDTTPTYKKIGYKDLVNDKDTNGNLITLKVENNLFSFEKGIFAHATSTLIYDLTNYSDYKYFVAFIGLNNTAASSSNGVTYHFYTSLDNQNWTEIGEGTKKKPGENATYVEIPLNNAKYIKFFIDSDGGNGNDHSVFADAKLVKSLENNFVIPSYETYDNEIKTKYSNQTEITNDFEFTLLKRELLKNVGQYTINSFYNASTENADTINWLMNNQDILRYYILGGTPAGGSYYNSLTQLSRLYNEYGSDFNNTESLNNDWIPGSTYGDLYKRMAITLSLTHSQNVGLWMQSGRAENQSDALRRYAIFKYLHKDGRLRSSKMFEALNVEEMRFVMNNSIDDEEIIWLNSYVTTKIKEEPNKAWITPHPHMAYVWPNYNNPVYYDDANKDYFNELFAVYEPSMSENKIGLFDLEYTIPGGKNVPEYKISVSRGTSINKIQKVWMNFRNKFGTGAVCGGISKSGSNIRTSHGIPATVIGQPGHAALLFYSKDAQGKGYWGIDNDVSGWSLSEKGERMLLGWGNGYGYSVVYMALAQEVLNDYENFQKAEEMIMLARAYSGDAKKQEELLRKAIEIQSINIDAWRELINVYNNSNNKTEDDYYNLAEELAENLKYFPLPMYNLTNLIKPKLTSIENSYRFTLLQSRILTEASKTPSNTDENYYVYQPSVTRTEANYLLGKIDSTIATFSFDGSDAGKIVLSSRFDGNGIRWDYSIDGKKTWNEVSFTGDEEHKLQLTKQQIETINEENDIYVHIVGVSYDESNLYKIDINKGSLLSSIFANDLENRLVGVNLSTEWRYKETDAWTSYNLNSPDLTGNKTIQIRQAATGTYLASDASEIYTFTLDNQPDTRKYIPVSHLSIVSVSTEAVNNAGAAINAIDGNYNTRYHSAWNGTDTNRFMIIKLDKVVSLSAVEFVPSGGGNGKIYDGTIYGSMDGENWEELANLKNLTYTNQANTIEDAIKNTKSFEIADPKEVQYVKIVADRTNGNWFTARAFNLYQDITKNPHPTAGIAYSTTETTNGKVVARLVNPSTNITITNNGGSDTYTFSENGDFTFEFIDENGLSGSAVAIVNWIDKDIPTADVKYNLDDNKKMSISLDGISEDVYLLDKNDKKINYIEVENGKVKYVSYLDSSNNMYKIVDVDENGCITKITYKNTSNKVTSVATYVTIVKDGVVASEEYYDIHGNSVEVSDSDKEVLKGLRQSIDNPLEYTFEESGSYEFKLLDKASNIAYKNIKADYVNNIIIASDITYDITSLTNKNVVATINPYIFDENGKMKAAQIINGELTHVFKENGKFTFKYKDNLDVDNYNVKEHTAAVNWIDKKNPTAKVKYTTKENGSVVATLVNESEEILITNNSSSREYTFVENGEFKFEFVDMAGNKGSVVAKVDWIKKEEEPSIPVEPENPVTPVEPEKPTEPENPTTPVTPSEPEKPVENTPTTPSKPTNGNNTNNNNNNSNTNVVKPNNNNNSNNTTINKPESNTSSTTTTKPDNESSNNTTNDNKTDNNKTETSENNSSKKEENVLEDDNITDNRKHVVLTNVAITILVVAFISVMIMIFKKNKKNN